MSEQEVLLERLCGSLTQANRIGYEKSDVFSDFLLFSKEVSLASHI